MIQRNNRRGKGKGNKKQRRKITRGHGDDPYHIGQIKNAPIMTRAIRYRGDLASFSYQVGDLMQTIGFATSTTVGYSIIGSAKLERVKVVLLPQTGVSSSSLSFKWGGNNVPTDEYVMNTIGSVPVSKNFYPPEDTNASWWHSQYSSTEVLFTFLAVGVACPMYVDLEFSWVMLADPTSNALSAFYTTATANTIVYPSQPVSETVGYLNPVGLPTC